MTEKKRGSTLSLAEMESFIVRYIEKHGDCAVEESELQRVLKLPKRKKTLMQQALSSLIRQKKMACNRSYMLVKKEERQITGQFRWHPKGFGFVTPFSDAEQGDIFIPKSQTLQAAEGDCVEIEISLQPRKKGKREGKVVQILEKKESAVVAIVMQIDDCQGKKGIAYVPQYADKRHVAFSSRNNCLPIVVGDRVQLDVSAQSEKQQADLVAKLGNIDQPKTDIPMAATMFSLAMKFPPSVQKEVDQFSSRVLYRPSSHRQDLRDLDCFTIDPQTARDYDDAVSLTRDKYGKLTLGVHIADVSHYVKRGSALDQEAKRRCHSAYFPGECLPMLPKELSNELCSLKPNVNRFTVSVFMTFDLHGKLLQYDIVRGVIRSRSRFTYEEVSEIIAAKRSSRYRDTIMEMVTLCQLLQKQRSLRGGVHFSLPEVVLKMGENGIPLGAERIEYDISHQMIEEFMVKTNEVIARHLNQHRAALCYRVHEDPDEETLEQFAHVVRLFGHDLSPPVTQKKIQQLFDHIQEKPCFSQLVLQYIKSMKMACYSTDHQGHYGLALPYYTHFTSPIRRYIDLVIHRLVLGEEYEESELKTIAKQCSEQERITAFAEEYVTRMKKIRLLQTLHKEDGNRLYSALVVQKKPYGILFDIGDLALTGFVKIPRRGPRLSIGEAIKVQVREIDVIAMEVNWKLYMEKRRDSSRSRKRSVAPR